MTAQNTFERPINLLMTPLWALCYVKNLKKLHKIWLYDDICNHKRASILLICQKKSI